MKLNDLDRAHAITLKESHGFFKILDESGVGKIVKGVNTTPDVGPSEIKRQASKMKFKTTVDGIPPTLKPNGIVNRK